MPLGNPIRKQNESRMVSVLATEGQTVFTVQGGYIINHISVFRNGVRLSPAEDFTAGDGSTVTLNNAANIDDRIDFHIFDRFTVQNAIVGAASTQTINGDLVLNGKLFGQLDVPSINLTGIVTATELDLNGKGDISSDLTIGRHLNVVGVTTLRGLSIFGNTTGLQVASGISTFQAVTGTTGTFSGAVSGTTGTFSGAVSGTTGTFSGAVSGTTGTFTGDVDIADKIIHTGDTNTAIRFPSADTISFETAGSERLRIDDSGRVLYGHTSNISGSTFQWFLGIGGAAADFYVASDNDQPAQLNILKTRASTPSGNTILQDGDKIGELRFRGNTGAGYVNGAVVQAIVNGTPGSGNDLPTDLVFRLQPDGSGNTGEVARFTSGALMGLGTNAPTGRLSIASGTFQTTTPTSTGDDIVISGNNSLGIQLLTEASGTSNNNIYFGDTDDPDIGMIRYAHADNSLQFRTNTSERLRIDSSGRLLLGLTSDSRTTSMIISGNSSDSTSQAQLHMDFGSTSISNDTSLGIIRFGATGDRRGADIRGLGDGTWSAGSSHPTRLAFYTNDASSASTPTERLRIDKDGKLSTGGESAPDIGPGGLCLQKGSDGNKAFTIKCTQIAHGVTTYDETDTYFSIGQSSSNKGGAEIRGYTDAAGADPAIRMRGIIASDSDQTYTPLVFVGAEANGTGVQNIATDRRIASFQNSDGSRIVNVTGTGIVFGDTSPAATNALDDYEEGTWSPQIYYQNSTNQSNSTNNASYGWYTKIGDLVTVSFFLRFSLTGSPANDNNGVKNFPFTSSTVTSTYGNAGAIAIVSHSGTDLASDAAILLKFQNNNSTVALFELPDSTSNLGNEMGANTGMRAWACFSYRTTQ